MRADHFADRLVQVWGCGTHTKLLIMSESATPPHPGECRGERDQRERHVDEEDRPPAERADQDAADRQPEGRGRDPGDQQAAQHAARRLVQPGVPGTAADQQHRGGTRRKRRGRSAPG
jgi:hypothetical protein